MNKERWVAFVLKFPVRGFKAVQLIADYGRPTPQNGNFLPHHEDNCHKI
ncbi:MULTISPECIES: hypothetical protein [Microcystis]|nr:MULTISPECIES: hypothetical protein [Microcystis]